LIQVKELVQGSDQNFTMLTMRLCFAVLLFAAGVVVQAMGIGAAGANPASGPAVQAMVGADIGIGAGVPAKAPCSHAAVHQSHAGCVSASCPFDSSAAGGDGPLQGLHRTGIRPEQARFLHGIGAAPPFHPPRLSTRV
jgi:hypothetical protein